MSNSPFSPNLLAPALAQAGRVPRILLYSHDTFGIGNLRRTLLLAGALAESLPGANTLIVTGSPMAHGFPLPAGADYVKLPALVRTAPDVYEARLLSGCSRQAIAVRAAALEAAARAFDPDLVIVDKRPRGVAGELMPAIRALHNRGRARLALGMRDILDEPERARASLARWGCFEAIERYYDEVWIFGSRPVYDAVREDGFPLGVARKTRFCGYLGRPAQARRRRADGRRVMVTIGGGDDGFGVIDTFVRGWQSLPEAERPPSDIFLGPLVPADLRGRLEARLGGASGVRVHGFTPDLGPHYASADVVVAMAGYNTVCELLSYRRPAVLVPRTAPVREQLVRARRFAELGIFELMEGNAIDPDRLLGKVGELLRRPRPTPPAVDLDGRRRAAEFARALLENPRVGRARHRVQAASP